MNTDPAGVHPGQPLTRQVSPRVLVDLSVVKLSEDIVEQLQGFVPTVKVITSHEEVNLTEWDVLVTDQAPINNRLPLGGAAERAGDRSGFSWRQWFPENLCLLLIMDEEQYGRTQALDVYPPSGRGTPQVALVQRDRIVGSHISESKVLPDGLADLVRRVMVPAVKKRKRHTSIARSVVPGSSDAAGKLQFRPFLFGPENCILAGSYERSEKASVWVIPGDVPDTSAWLREALRDWHTLDPARFPVIPDWDNDPAWKSAAELEIIARKEQVEAEIQVQIDELRNQHEALDAELEVAGERADAYERALLTKDGEVLERAVEQALADLGFEVQNMDEVWPQGQRREDLRVRTTTDTNWVAIVEVKGYTKGAKVTDLYTTGRWAEGFLADEGRRPSARWFVTNHNRQRDPYDRGQPFANNQDLVNAYATDGGLVIDTVTLFEALRLVQADPSRRDEIRDQLINASGRLELT
ncbi:hypothetical protein ACWZJV_15005 [Nocardioides sp. WG-D5]